VSEAPPKPLDQSFYNRPTLTVARDLLGHRLVYPHGSKWRWLEINETEAYDGPEDQASHAYRGRTKRNEVMFEKGGVWYIYLCYGIHWLANIVTGPSDYPAAVLLRGAGPLDGPAKLSRAIGITGKINRQPASSDCGFFIAKGNEVKGRRIRSCSRIGVDYAGPVWSGKPYRFLLSPPET